MYSIRSATLEDAGIIAGHRHRMFLDMGKYDPQKLDLMTNAYKPYPCGVVLFPVIDGCLELRERHALSADRIAAVTVRGHPLLRIRTDRPDVTNGRAAKVSVQHSVAVAFIYGAAGLSQYADQCVQ